jgi:serine protease Do
MLTAQRLWTCALVGALITAMTAQAAATSIDYKKLYQQASPGVVLIHGTDKQSGSQGTGSIIDSSGLVLTNTHVIRQGGKVWPYIYIYTKPATLTGDLNRDLKAGYPARVVALNASYDLAVLQIVQAPADLTVLSLSTLEGVDIGEPTVAIGHPGGGAAWSLTTGTIGASFHDMMGRTGWHVFQTETALNPGNSGGPLIDGSGSVIGINTFIRRRGRDGLALVGLNFAVKSTTARTWLAAVLGQLPDAQTVSSATPAEAKKPVEAPKKLAAPQHDRQTAPPPQSATEESTVSASTNSASGNWRVVRKKTAKAPKRAMKRPPRRSKKGYTAAKGNGYVFTGKELQAVARRRSEAFGDLDRAVRED